MRLLSQILFLLVFSGAFLGCESKNSYDIGSDKAVEDMSLRISSLDSDLKVLKEELAEIKKVLKDPDIDAELRSSVRKEIHEGEKHVKDIQQWISYLKVRRKKRYNSLVDRKGQPNLKEEAQKEVEAYFMDKKLNPIKRKWKDRYRTAIEL
jgi:hypothetical protein